MIYCCYNPENNALVGVSDKEPSEGVTFIVLGRGMPDFATEEWNPATLAFFTKVATPISKMQFLKHLTVVEYATIKAAAAQSPEVDYFWQLFMSAENIILSNPDTVAGIYLLEQAGLLAQGRATEILA